MGAVVASIDAIRGDWTLLARKSKEQPLVLPAEVLRELRHAGAWGEPELESMIENLRNEKVIEVYEGPAPENSSVSGLQAKLYRSAMESPAGYGYHFIEANADRIRKAHRFGESLQYLIPALNAAGPGSQLLASESQIPYCKQCDIPYISPKDYVHNTTPIADVARKLRVAQWKRMTYGAGIILVTVAIPFLLAQALYYGTTAFPAVWGWLTTTFPVWCVVAGLFILGVGLYQFRCRGRFWYGLCECGVGIAISYWALGLTSEKHQVNLPSLVASLYVIVRGLDNVGKSLIRDRPKKLWVRLFGPNY